MKKLIFFLLLFFSCVTSLFAQNSYKEFEKSLELTEPQKAQVQTIRNKYINEWQTVRKESMRKKLELKELCKNSAAGPEKCGKLENELRDMETVRGNIYNQYRGEVSRVLNEKQRERYNNFFNAQNRKMTHPPQPGRHDR
jgi:septal ring factor EnvC (AmiA/AmiB activator)